MVFQDRTLNCVECGTGFTFSADDQSYHQERGYTNEPKRCPSCRELRRAERRSSGEGGGGGGGYGAPREMFPVVCAQCGKDAEVPFRPRGDRPVYCNDCYSSTRSTGGSYS